MAADTLINDFELPFQLYDVLGTQTLTEHAKFSEHSRETFDAVLDTANKIATDLFLPHNHLADKNEPQFDGKKVSMISDVKVAFDAFRESGFIAGRYSFEDGGMQLPETVMTAVAGYFMAANPSTTAYPFLTTAAINVISHFASEDIKAAFMPRMLTGEFTGTMALTEPHAGSSLADIKTTAVKQEDGSYRIKGSKIYISAGDHELSDNIVHLVLAKIPGGPSGVKGISLFAVPKYRLNDDMSVGERNDVHLTGLIHKLGVVSALAGSEYLPRIKGGIVFLEDVGEQAYRIERMLYDLYLAGVFKGQQAIVFGALSGSGEDSYDKRYDVATVIRQLHKLTGLPIYSGMRFGHIGQKHSFPLGATCQLTPNIVGGYQLSFSNYPTIKADAIHVEGLWQAV